MYVDRHDIFVYIYISQVYFMLQSTQGKIIQSLRKQKEDLIEQNNSLRSRNDSFTKEKKQLLDQIEFLRQPKVCILMYIRKYSYVHTYNIIWDKVEF